MISFPKSNYYIAAVLNYDIKRAHPNILCNSVRPSIHESANTCELLLLP